MNYKNNQNHQANRANHGQESSESNNQANQGSDGYLHGDLTRRIIGCAMRVHSVLGNGFSRRDHFVTGGDLSAWAGN